MMSEHLRVRTTPALIRPARRRTLPKLLILITTAATMLARFR